MKIPKDVRTILLLLLFAVAFIYISYNYPSLFNLNRILRNRNELNESTEEVNKSNISRKLPVLMYHYIEDVEDRENPRFNLATKPSVLENQIDTLLKAGYIFITPNELNTALNDLDNKYVILTFDDGYADFYTNVFPLLKKYNIKAINYIMPNFIGDTGYLAGNQIKELINSGYVEIGSHTINHIALTSVDTERINFEIQQSKDELENAYNIDITSFAYPYGFYNEEIRNIVVEAGYKNAVTTLEGNEISENNLFEIYRIRPGINTGDDLLLQIENY